MDRKYDWSTNIVDIADDFYEAYRRCNEEKPIISKWNGAVRGSVVNVPVIVNGSFALELYMKSILMKEGKNYRKYRHNIYSLFYALNPNLQKQVKETIEPHLKGWRLKFDEALEGIKDSFEYWRYIHEKENFGFGLNMSLNILSLFVETIGEIVHGNQKAD